MSDSSLWWEIFEGLTVCCYVWLLDLVVNERWRLCASDRLVCVSTVRLTLRRQNAAGHCPLHSTACQEHRPKKHSQTERGRARENENRVRGGKGRFPSPRPFGFNKSHRPDSVASGKVDLIVWVSQCCLDSVAPTVLTSCLLISLVEKVPFWWTSRVSDQSVLLRLLGGVGAAALLQGFCWGTPGDRPSPRNEAWRVWPKRRTAPFFTGEMRFASEVTRPRGRTRLVQGSYETQGRK